MKYATTTGLYQKFKDNPVVSINMFDEMKPVYKRNKGVITRIGALGIVEYKKPVPQYHLDAYRMEKLLEE